MNRKVSWGIIGMGVMGTNISRNFASQGHSVALYNRFVKGKEENIALKCTQEYSELKNALAFEELDLFVSALKFPRKILLMIPSGLALEKILEELIPMLSQGDVLIDGGNSHYNDTEKRASLLNEKKIHFLGMGVSGGKIGALNGPSLMIGGNLDGYKIVNRDLESIAAKDIYGTRCCSYLGLGGAGHYIKMVHNGIEYAEMQLLAEIFELSMTSPALNFTSIHKELSVWEKSFSQSYLLEITSEILTYNDDGIPFINKILDKASNKGTVAWAIANGALLGSPNSLMASALHARFTSSLKSKREKLSKSYKIQKGKYETPLKKLKKVYDVSRLINHHQGFEMIKSANDKFSWEINFATVARLWSEGSIIKSQLMNALVKEFQKNDSIIEMEKFKKEIIDAQEDWISIIKYALDNVVPIPCIYSAWNYFISMTQSTSNGNLIQAQRDFFGAHGFQRVDQKKDTLSHGPWSKKT